MPTENSDGLANPNRILLWPLSFLVAAAAPKVEVDKRSFSSV